MARPEPHEPEKLTRYAFGNLSPGEQAKLEEHIRGCAPCRDYLSFVQEFNASVREAKPPQPIADEPCPDSALLVDLEAGELDEQTAHHVRAHMLFCGDCRDTFYALRRATRKLSWHGLVEKLKETAVDLSKSYGIGTLLGPVKIVGEELAFATRGEGRPPTISKVFEVPVGDNNYSVELGITREGSLYCDIAGFKTPVWVPLGVSVHDEEGVEVFAAETDRQGNARFTLIREELPRDVCFLFFTLNDSESYLPFHMPQATEPA